MDQKNIDKLFQEQLKNLEVSPNKKIWNTLESQLIKKKRRVFPFWWFSGAIASILVLTLFLYPFSEDENQKINTNSNEIITTIPEKKSVIQDKIDTLIFKKKTIDKAIVITKNPSLKSFKKKVKVSINKKKKSIIQSKRIAKSILLNNNSIDKNLFFGEEKPIMIITDLADKHKVKKIDLNDFLKSKQPLEPKSSDKKIWSIAPMFAVLRSNSFTNTSPINESLANSTKGENTYSYGFQIGYKLNKKWSIQSGIHLQEMSFTNNQIGIYNTTTSSSSVTEFGNGDSFSFDNGSSENLSLSSDFQSSNISPNGNLIQNYGYIEIPVEIKYNFSNNTKFETQLVTGFSSLFLNKNEVTLNTTSLSKALEVTNLNNINFSGNLGFDFNYLFNKNWSLNLNPMLKVQLNTFNKNANGFAPFNIGIYSGITYKF